LLFGTIGVNYALVRGMLRSTTPRLYLVASVGITLGVLLLFKYAALAVETAAPVLARVTGEHPRIPAFLLPLGIFSWSPSACRAGRFGRRVPRCVRAICRVSS
jgi:hypothetical protein